MMEFFKKRWFLISLLILIVTGITLGYTVEASKIEAFRERVPARWVTAFVLLLMAYSLDSRQLKAAFKSPAPVVWACSTNYILIPLLGLALMKLQRTPDFTIGLMIACSTPCTLAACSVWTRKAGGNDAVSLLTTLTTNTACFIVAPLWLTAASSLTANSSDPVNIDLGKLAGKLIFVVLIPTIAGQLIRQPAKSEEFARENKTAIGVIAQSSILFLVFLSACAGGVKLQQQGGISTQLAGIFVVWLSCVAIHLTALAVAWFGGRLFGFERQDRIGAAFSGSQKTLPIGVYLATDQTTFGGPAAFLGQAVPFAVFPMLMFHASQLFLDTIVADKMNAEGKRIEEASTATAETADSTPPGKPEPQPDES